MLLSVIILFSSLSIAAPTGPSGINITANETKNVTAGVMVNISGGTISKINVTASVKNAHWKAFVGWIDGKFTLDDSSGSTIYDWSLSATSGQIYATRAPTTPAWQTISCANATEITAEDATLNHTGSDNITSTFTAGSNIETFTVAGTPIGAGTCSAMNTYDNNGPQSSKFEEVILHDATNVIFTTILEDNQTGYDGSGYDFQMIVPEVSDPTWSGATAYYLYVELVS